MPISTGKAYVIYFKKRAPIVVLVDDVFAICDTVITLTAQVFGNTTNRTYYWEQISGPGITWLTPQDQLSVMWSPTTTVRTDRLFYFYIDKDEATEELYEVWAYATPTDQYLPVRGSPVRIDLGYWQDAGGNNRENINATSPATELFYSNDALNGSLETFSGYSRRPWQLRLVPAASISSAVNVPVTSGAGQSNTYVVVWAAPLASTANGFTGLQATAKVREYVVQENDGTGWVDVGTFPYPSLYPATTGYSYRVITRWENEFPEFTLSPLPREDVSAGVYAEPDAAKFGTYAVSNLQPATFPEQNPVTDYDVIVRVLTVADWNTYPELDDDQYEAEGPIPNADLTTVDGPHSGPAAGDYFDYYTAGRLSLTDYNVIIRTLTVVDWNTYPELDDDQYEAEGPLPNADLTEIVGPYGPSDAFDFYTAGRISVTNYFLTGGGTIGG